MKTSSELNPSLFARLIKYQRVLGKLKSMGLVQVFSNNLGDAVGVSAAVVRKDFSQIEVPGNKRGGYNIDVLRADLTRILGSRSHKDVILVGCGRIGRALLNYQDLSREDIRILAGFDNDPARLDPRAAIPVLPMEALEDFVKEHGVEVGILAVPEASAPGVFQTMTTAGIKGVLNFSTAELKCLGRCDRDSCPRPCAVSNINIGLELENLFHLAGMENKRPVFEPQGPEKALVPGGPVRSFRSPLKPGLGRVRQS